MTQVKQALQQDRDKTEKQVRELTTDLAQVKQALLDRDKAEKQVREPTTELTQVKQALQQDRDKTEKQVREHTTTWRRSSRRCWTTTRLRSRFASRPRS